MRGRPGDGHDRAAAVTDLQQRLGSGLPVPVQPVGRRPDHPGALGGVLARGQVAGGRPDQQLHLVTGVGGGDAGGPGQRPGPAVLTGPDGVRADGQPAAGARGDQLSRVPGGGLAAARGVDRRELPAGPVVGGDEELGPGEITAGLVAHRDHGAAGTGHPGQRLEHAVPGRAAGDRAELPGLGGGVGPRAQPSRAVPGVSPARHGQNQHDRHRHEQELPGPARPAVRTGAAPPPHQGRPGLRAKPGARAKRGGVARSGAGAGPFGPHGQPGRLGPLPD